MKIDSSNVSMSSNRSYFSYEKVEQESLTVLSSRAATIELSDDSKNLAEQLREKKAEIAEEEKAAAKEKEKNQKENLKKSLEDMVKANKANKADLEIPTEEDNELKMLRRILELLKKIRGEKGGPVYVNDSMKSFAESMNKAQENLAAFAGNMACTMSGASPAVQANPGHHTVNMTNWTKITVQSKFYMETESTAYRSSGSVRTEDGRELSFELTVEMSRSFTAEYGSYMEESYTMVDPLVIELDDKCADLTEKTFLFDLDADGKEERIYDLRENSGLLALDKNGDGKINDGSELFGTKSGNGFKDLAAYDEDGNGWIDENDSIFKKLKIWTKDKNGKDVLLDLKKADVGAINLGSVATDFALKSLKNNATMGQVKRTGFFLKESTGEAGAVQHVNLAV
jgi:hypothetical protein